MAITPSNRKINDLKLWVLEDTDLGSAIWSGRKFTRRDLVLNINTGVLKKGPGLWASMQQVGGGAKPYRSVVMRVTTPSAADQPPIVQYLENELGYQPTWSYQEVGRYVATLPNLDYRKIHIVNRFIHDLAEQRNSWLLQAGNSEPNTELLLQLCDISDANTAIEYDGETVMDFEFRIYDSFDPDA